MTASVTKSVEEAQEPEKRVSNWVTWMSGKAQSKAGKNRLHGRRRAGVRSGQELKSGQAGQPAATSTEQGKQLRLRQLENEQ